MKRKLTAGQTSVNLPIFIVDTSSTTGGGLSGLVYNTASLVAEYRRRGDSAWTTITLQTKTLGTWVSGGFIADGALAGAYELDLPDAACASGARWVAIRLRGATNMLACLIEIELDVVNYQTAIFGAMASYTNPTGFLTATFPTTVASSTNVSDVQTAILAKLPSALTANGNMKSSLVEIITTALTEGATGRIAAAWQAFWNVASPTGNVNSLPAAIPGNSAGLPRVSDVPTTAQMEAAILNEGDATALLAAIAAKVEQFLINEGDATATIAAIAAACNAAVAAGTVGTNAATAATQATAAASTATTINTKIGTPAGASVSADVAAVGTNAATAATQATSAASTATTINTKIGTPSGASVSADVAAVGTNAATAATQATTAATQATAAASTATTINTKIGTPAASVSADVAAVKADTASLLTRVTSAVYTMWTDLIAMITTQKFTTSALSNAPAGGGGGGTESDLLVSTTIASVTSQTVLVLTAGSPDNSAYNGCQVIITDSVTNTQKAVGTASGYVGSSKTLTLSAAPLFVVSAGDTVAIKATSTNPAVSLSLGATIPLTLGEITGLTEPLVIGDDYTVDVGRRIPITLTDTSGAAIAVTYGSHSLATNCTINALFHPEGQHTVLASLTGSCEFVAAVGATPAYLWLTLPQSETIKAAPGKYQTQIEVRWADGFNVTLAYRGVTTFARDIKRRS